MEAVNAALVAGTDVMRLEWKGKTRRAYRVAYRLELLPFVSLPSLACCRWLERGASGSGCTAGCGVATGPAGVSQGGNRGWD